MKKLVVEYDPCSEFATLVHPYNKRFVTYISQGIKPMSYRRFDATTKKWSVHLSKIPQVISAGKRLFDYIDYKSLPDDLQIKVVQFLEGSQSEIHPFCIKRRPHAVLHVLPTAPVEVIKAAYKALATKHHPDHGGDPEVFMEIQDAYEKLTK